MRYLPHILLAYVAIGLQRGLDDLLTAGGWRLSLPAIAAAYLATRLPWLVGALAAALVGLAHDLTGAEPIGLHAVAFGLAGLVVGLLPSNRPLRLWGALLAGIAVATSAAWILGALRGPLRGDPAGMTFAAMLGTILLTGLFALPMSWPLHRWGRVFHTDGGRF